NNTTNSMLKTASAFILAATCFLSFPACADEIQVKELNRGPTGFFVFAPELVRIKPGDTIDFIASDRGHDVHSVNGMIPDGAQPIDGKTNQDTKVTLSLPGVYVIACKVHTLMGIDPSGLPPRARAKIQTLLDQIRNK